jgi:hypothetical protein
MSEHHDAWAELRQLTVACQGHEPMRFCSWCDHRFARIREVVERLRDPKLMAEEKAERERVRKLMENIPVRRLPRRPQDDDRS